MGFDQSLDTLREALKENPRLREMLAEEVAGQLVLGGHLEGEPVPPLVAEALEDQEAESRVSKMASSRPSRRTTREQ